MVQYNINMRNLHSGSKAQCKEDAIKPAFKDAYVDVVLRGPI